ncbi:family 43 glycosylhydrolase [Asticcacaulis sp. YBE204]|uniref:glycoside hydrolase family 43 protein n=1 Tax=Asticcacaulis sp. YBE204 TaxID=1282363 RepID=UPI0003C3C12E|nr:glycoside hydrolase family 43 protein [Asticcacaulis sp. YBE204]ESQ78900.1 hypothetical protein AEYBE204_10780 [Asticcacaulis sp. YBE204]
MTTRTPPFSRRHFMLGAATTGAALTTASQVQAKATPIVNPVVLQRADAQIFHHTDGYYYMTASVPEYDRLILRRSKTLGGFTTTEEVVVWKRPATGQMGGYIWAPELHWFGGQWHLYFAAGNSDDKFHIRTYVLSCKEKNPLKGKWSLTGQVEMPWDSFNLDSTVFEHKGVRYLCWAQKEPGIATNSNLYLAPLVSPTKLGTKPVRLTVPTLDWEIVGYKVAEAPAFLVRNDRIFLTYSAAATDANYCLGMLTARADADLMNPDSWVKSQQPVFKTSAKNKVFGPGHNSFTVDEKGRDVLVYHGRDYEQVKSPLHDPNRHTRMQYFTYRADGTPDFGEPVANGLLK